MIVYAQERDSCQMLSGVPTSLPIFLNIIWHPKGTQLPLEQIISYVKQVAAALEYLHTHQVLHRNLRPDHLLVGHRQQLLVCGFGVALQMQPLSFQEKQEVVGTLTYLAPEQLQGRPVPA